MLLQILVGGVVTLDLNTPPAGPYQVISGSTGGFGEPEIDARYVEEMLRHGSRLSDRRFRNRQVTFTLGIRVSSGGTDEREAARNAVADAIDQARRWQLQDPPGTTVDDGEVLLKYRDNNATETFYARILDGAVGSSEMHHGGGGRGSAVGIATDMRIPVTLIIEPFWRLERDPHLVNYLTNADFELGTLGSTANAWSDTTITGTPTSANGALTTAYARTGRKAFRLRVSGADAFTLGLAASVLGGSDVLALSDGGGGAIEIFQSVTPADHGLSAGETVRLSARVRLNPGDSAGGVAGVKMVFYDGATPIQTVSGTATTAGDRYLTAVSDIPTGTTAINCFLTAATTSGTFTAYFDNVLFDDHNHGYQLLRGGNFDEDTPGDTGLSYHWRNVDVGRTASSLTRPSSPKYDGVCQQAAVTGTGDHGFEQDVLLSDTPLRAGDVATFAAWGQLVSGAGYLIVKVFFLDITGEELASAVSDSSTSATYTWLGASGRVPFNTHTIRCQMVDSGDGAATVRWDWAILHPGHHDGSGGRLWPTPEWIGSSLLTGDAVSTDKEITIAHADFRGNVPAPCQMFVAPDDEVPHPLIVGYKREDTTFIPYSNTSNAAALTSEVADPVADGAAITGYARRWFPTSTDETRLLRWPGSDTPPGRYLIVLRARPSSTDTIAKLAFRAAVRVADGGSTAGTWDLDLHPAPEWVTDVTGYGLWVLGSLPLPLLQRLPRYVSAVYFELYGRYSESPAGGAYVALDGLYFVPLDGYFRSLASPLSTRPTGYGTSPYYQVTIDGITPVPGGLYSNAGGDPVLTLPATVADRPDSQDDGIALGESGKFVLVSSGRVHDKTDKIRVALRYRPYWTTAGGAS